MGSQICNCSVANVMSILRFLGHTDVTALQEECVISDLAA